MYFISKALRAQIFFFLILFVNSIYASSQIEDFVNKYKKDYFLNAVYGIYKSDSVIFEGANGYAIKEAVSVVEKKEVPLSINQKMAIASGTKQMTAALILKLAEQNKLTLQDKISKHLPSDSFYWANKMPKWADDVTLHHLLIHASGIVDYIMKHQIDFTKEHKEINQGILSFAAANNLEFTPGEKFSYNNTGYVILGVIIEEITKKTLAQVFHEEIFAPLGMNDTHLASLQEAIDYQDGKLSHIFANRYFLLPTNSEPVFIPADKNFKLAPFSDGGVISSLKDMNIWMQALYSGKILSQKSLDMMTYPHILSGERFGHDSYYGYGVYVNNINGHKIFSHAGNAIAIRGEYNYVFDLKTSIIVLSNTMVHVPKDSDLKIDMSLPQNKLDVKFFSDGLLEIITGK